MADDDLAELERRMAEAVAGQDYELAARLRDEIARAGGGRSRLKRQVPGQMGLGTDQPAYTPPQGWVPPAKPDLMTSNRKPRKGGR